MARRHKAQPGAAKRYLKKLASIFRRRPKPIHPDEVRAKMAEHRRKYGDDSVIHLADPDLHGKLSRRVGGYPRGGPPRRGGGGAGGSGTFGSGGAPDTSFGFGGSGTFGVGGRG